MGMMACGTTYLRNLGCSGYNVFRVFQAKEEKNREGEGLVVSSNPSLLPVFNGTSVGKSYIVDSD